MRIKGYDSIPERMCCDACGRERLREHNAIQTIPIQPGLPARPKPTGIIHTLDLCHWCEKRIRETFERQRLTGNNTVQSRKDSNEIKDNPND